MRLFQNWWERAPIFARVFVIGMSLAGMVLGGRTSGYWD
jgi:hypothetical protein